MNRYIRSGPPRQSSLNGDQSVWPCSIVGKSTSMPTKHPLRSLLTQRDYVPSLGNNPPGRYGQTCSNIEGSIRQAGRVTLLIPPWWWSLWRVWELFQGWIQHQGDPPDDRKRLEASGKVDLQFHRDDIGCSRYCCQFVDQAPKQLQFSKENMDDEVLGYAFRQV